MTISISSFENFVQSWHSDVQWTVPEFRDRWYGAGKRCLDVSGKWMGGKLNGKGTIRVTENNIVNNDYPSLTGTFRNNVLLNGSLHKSGIRYVWNGSDRVRQSVSQWTLKFESIEISECVEFRHNCIQYNWSPNNHREQFSYRRVILFKNALWTFANGFKCIGNFISTLDPTLEVTCGYGENEDLPESIKCCPFGLKWFDLLASFRYDSEVRIYQGKCSFDFFKACKCPVSYEITAQQSVESRHFVSPQHTGHCSWVIGPTRCPGHSHAPSSQSKCFKAILQDAPKLQLRFVFDYTSACSKSHTHSLANLSCFGQNNHVAICPFKYFSFIPTNTEKLIQYLKRTNKIDQNVTAADVQKLQVILHTNVKLSKRICLDFKVTMEDACKITCHLELNENEAGVKNTKTHDFDLYADGIAPIGCQVSLKPFLERFCTRDVHACNIVINEIENLKQLGVEFSFNTTSLSMVCNLIKSGRQDLVSHFFSAAFGQSANQADFSYADIAKTVMRAYSELDANQHAGFRQNRRDSWTLIFQTQKVEFIEAFFVSRIKAVSATSSWVDVCMRMRDEQDWNVLFYAAYLDLPKLVKTGQKLIDTVMKKFSDDRQARSWKKVRKTIDNWYFQTDLFGNLPTHIAAQFGHDKILEQLLRAEGFETLKGSFRPSQLLKENHDGWTPLGLAMRYDQKKCVQVLLKFSRPNWKTLRFNGWTLMTLLLKSEAWDTLQEMVYGTDDVEEWLGCADDFGLTEKDYYSQLRKAPARCRSIIEGKNE